MKHIYSLIACGIIALVLFQQRMAYPGRGAELKLTDWDALGYYMYLPGLVIYDDVAELKWMDSTDRKYAVSGGELYQAGKQENGKYVFKYLGGVAILQAPFFLAAHVYGKNSGYPADGFSKPYQYAVALAAIFYCLLGIFVLRRVLLFYFKDGVVAATLLLLCLATNLAQYVSVNGGMSHAYIFPLYALVLYTTIKWHNKPNAGWAMLTGYIIGLATISRPTEAAMLSIPLLWDTHTKEAAKEKWRKVRTHRQHIILAILFGLIGILPQLLYWKSVTGSFIYDVGSKWSFANPFFRVLFGWEKGWFIYTPVTVFFIIGLFFVKKYPFSKSALWFCILNIYIIISWFDWRYGGSYSTRALVQSYPVFALPLAAFIQNISVKKWRLAFYLVGIYLIAVNIFQVWQYNHTILHYNDMNRRYYSRIYLNTSPSALDFSLLDTDEFINDEQRYKKTTISDTTGAKDVSAPSGTKGMLAELHLDALSAEQTWIKIECSIQVKNGIWDHYLGTALDNGDSAKQAKIRLFRPLAKDGQMNDYAFYIRVPEGFKTPVLRIWLESGHDLDATIEKLAITKLEK